MTSRRIGAYVGIDPTAESLHVGHLIPLMALMWMYINGYRAVTLVCAPPDHPSNSSLTSHRDRRRDSAVRRPDRAHGEAGGCHLGGAQAAHPADAHATPEAVGEHSHACHAAPRLRARVGLEAGVTE